MLRQGKFCRVCHAPHHAAVLINDNEERQPRDPRAPLPHERHKLIMSPFLKSDPSNQRQRDGAFMELGEMSLDVCQDRRSRTA